MTIGRSKQNGKAPREGIPPTQPRRRSRRPMTRIRSRAAAGAVGVVGTIGRIIVPTDTGPGLSEAEATRAGTPSSSRSFAALGAPASAFHTRADPGWVEMDLQNGRTDTSVKLRAGLLRLSQKQVPPLESLVLQGLPQHAAHLLEPGTFRHFRKVVDRPPVRSGDRVVEWQNGPSFGFEEREKKAALRCQCPMKFRKVLGYFDRRSVDNRVPRDDASEGAVSRVQCSHGADGELQIRIKPASVLDQRRRQINTEHLEAEVTQVGCYVTRSATQVPHGAGPGLKHKIRKRCENGTIKRKGSKTVSYEGDIFGRDSVVFLGCGAQVRFIGAVHADIVACSRSAVIHGPFISCNGSGGTIVIGAD